MRGVIFSLMKKGLRCVFRFRIEQLRITKLLWYRMVRPAVLYLYPNLIVAVLESSEEFEMDLFKKVLKGGDVVLDLGANIGSYTLTAAKVVGKDGHVFSFEPDGTNFSILQENVKAFKFHNVTLVRKAVTSKTGSIKLYLSDKSKGDHRIYDSRDGRKFVAIEAVCLDDYFKDYDKKIDVIKIDIQGAELVAFEGMRALLFRNEDVKIFTEFWPFGLKKFGVEPKLFLQLLISYGFRFYNISEEERRLEALTIEDLLETYTPEKENYTNLFCVKNGSLDSGNLRELSYGSADRL